MEIDNLIIHYKPRFKFLPYECNLRYGNTIVSRVARKDFETLYDWIRENDLHKLPIKIILHK